MARLLIVDDETDVREFAQNFFKRRKIDVTTAESGEQALSLLEPHKPDLILLDVRMDGMDGIKTLEKIRSQGNNVEVIMVTGVDEEAVTNRAKELGVVDYIHKPLILDELEKVVLARLAGK